MSCNICIEKYTKTIKAEITCGFCEFSACKICYKKYILSSHETVHCMSCKKKWDRMNMINKFGLSFVDKEYRVHYGDILFEKEKLLFPMTQLIIERNEKRMSLELKIEQCQAKIDNLENHFFILNNENYRISQIKNQQNNEQYKLEKIGNLKIMRAIQSQISKYTTLIDQLYIEMDIDKKKNVKLQYIKKCTFENCKGFLSSDLKCSLCKNESCDKCHEIKKENHQCNDDNVKTIKTLLKDTKPCPSCGCGIYKIDGCDQMYCTECHTAFSWKTGQIETGKIHNPHYYEWLRQNNNDVRDINDVQCGREIDNRFIYYLNSFLKKQPFIKYDFLSLCRSILHIQEVELPKYNDNGYTRFENTSLRILYLQNSISEDEFKRMLLKNDKYIEKNTAITHIITTYIQCMTDIMYRNIYDIKHNRTTEYKWVNEINEFQLYINKCFEKLAKIYNCKKIQLF
jgi:hypothetical protein